MSDIEIGSVWQGKNNEGDVVIVWANQNRVHYDYLNSLRKPLGNVYDTSVAHFLDYFEIKAETIDDSPDMVNQPKHYNDESGVPCCDVTDFMMFNGGNCFKYLYRCGSKFDDIEDLKKAKWYSNRAAVLGESVSKEANKNIRDVMRFREGNIYKAMRAVKFSNWMLVIEWLDLEIARLESEAVND